MLPLDTAAVATSVLVVGFASAIAGRLVDFSAVWFLFHPYRKIPLPLIRELGVLPRRQDALADQVASLIEDRLITKEGISEFLASDHVAGQVRQTVAGAVRQAADREYPSVRDLLTAELGSAEPVDREIRVLADWAGEQIAALFGQLAFQERVANLVSEVLEQRRSWQLEDLLPPGIFEAAERYLETHWDALAMRSATVASEIDGRLAALGLVTDFLPRSTLDWVRSTLKDRLPEWIAIAEELLQEPKVKAAMQTYVLDVLERVAASNPNVFSFEGLLGAYRQLFPEDFARRLESVIDVTLPRLRQALEDPQTFEFIAARIDMAVDEVATTPLGTYYHRLPERGRAEIRAMIATVLESPDARRSVLWLVDRILRGARTMRLEEALPAEVFRSDRVATGIRRIATSLAEEPAQSTLRRWVERGVGHLLAIPIGVPSRRVGSDRLAQVEDVAVGQILALLRNHSHQIAQAIDLKDMIRERIRAADPRSIEEVVKGRLAKREFNTIFLIGLLLGGGVGLVATAVFRWVALWGSWPAVLVVGVAIVLVMLRLVRV